jgi:hypothetical protein
MKKQDTLNIKLPILQTIVLVVLLIACNSSMDKNKVKKKLITQVNSNVKQVEDIHTDVPQDYSKYIDVNLKNKTQELSGKNFEEKIVYLGDLRTDDHKKFHVLTSFKTFQAAIVKHGHSNIYILDTDKNVIKQYPLSIPEELPFKIEKNSLCFHYKDPRTHEDKIFMNKIEDKLPVVMCVQPGSYY